MLRQNAVKWLNCLLLIALVASSQPYGAVAASPQQNQSITPSNSTRRSITLQRHAAAINVQQTQLFASLDSSESSPDRAAIQTSDRVTIRNNNFYSNGYGLYATTPIVAESNWWGDASGPYHPALNPDGQGDQVSDNVGFDPWLSEPLDLPHAPSGPEPPIPPQIHYNNFEGNGYGLYYTGDAILNAESNWWGDASGPHHPTLNPDGQGDEVSDNVDFEPWLTVSAELAPRPYDVDHNSAPSSAAWSPSVAEPVSVIFGNYTYQHTDLAIPGLGLDTSVQRTYNSANPQESPFGYGWTHTYAISATQETTSTVMVKNKDGRLDRFTEDGEGGYTPPPGTFNTLTENPDSTFTLTHKDQTQHHFDVSDRLASIVDKNGNTVALTYTGDNLTTITDAVGRTTALTYDANNHITQITDPAGRTVTYGYDVDGNLTSATDARGNTTTYAYDSEHRLTSITDANGHTFVQNTYDSQGRVIEQQDALSNLTTFSYDPAARQTTVTDPLGNQTVYTYDADWRATGETDALGYTKSYTYDEHNNRTSVTDKNGNTTYYAYDANGNTTVITDTMSYTTTMTYDGQNNLTGKTDALSRTTTFAYDTNGNLTSTANVSGTTSFAYDGLGQMISTTDANGNITQFGYDAYGYQTAITDTLGNVTTFTYDNVGRRLSETDANGNTTAYTYDAHNNLLTIADALVGVTSYTYDDVGNRIGVTDSLSHTTTYAYDEKDRLVSITDAMTNTTTYAYDANDNRIQETDALSHTTVYTYNTVNLLVQVEDHLSNVTTYTYDGNGNRTSVTDANGNATTFTYDALNRLTWVVDPLGHTTTYAYDAVGNKTSVTDANGNTTSYEYDALNRLIQVTDVLSGVVTYDYDPVGNKTAMTDANGHVTQYEYDSLNRLLRVTDPLSNTATYGYDAVGNKTSLLDANGDTTTYTYDALNRLIQITYPDSSVQYAYDAVGNRTAMTDTIGATTYVYDALDRLISVTNPGSSHTVSYSYDAVGNRTGITYPDSQQVTYTYDAANRLLTVTDWAAQVTSHTYDSAGNLTAVSNPNGTEASYSYDDANRLLQLTNTGPGGTISSFGYTLDDVGNRTQVVEAAGDVITYTYDALYRLTDVWEQMRVDFDSNCHVDVADIQQVASRWRMKDTDPGWDAWYDLDGDGDTDVVDIMLTVVHWGESCESASYTYDTMGNRLSMTIPTGTITYTYDAADRLLNISDGTTFTWDTNGNQLSKGSTNYTYDTANRLIQVANGTAVVQFTYDGDSKRTSKTVDGTSTSYLYDVNAILPVVLVETTGGADTLYTYGADLIAMTEPGGIQSCYHYDGLGSVRNLSNDTGAVIASYTYGAFGNQRLMKGSSDNAFKFTGEQTDDETGLIYLRARYYDPSVGRFISKDPFEGFDTQPQTLNRYPYAQNRPLVLTDPSGKIALLVVVGVAIVGYGIVKGVQKLADFAHRTDQAGRRREEIMARLADPATTDQALDEYTQWQQDFVQDVLPAGVEAATSFPGTSLTGRPGLPSSWTGLAIGRIGDWLRKAVFPINHLYRARLRFLIEPKGGVQGAMEIAPRGTTSFGVLLRGATPSYVRSWFGQPIIGAGVTAQPPQLPSGGK